MDNQIMINITGLDGSATAMTGCGDSNPKPRQRTPTPTPTPTSAPTPAPQDHLQHRAQKCLPLPTLSEDAETKGGRDRERTGSGDGEAAGVGQAGRDESTDGESTDDSETGDIEVDDDRRWSRRLSSHSHRSVRCPHGGCCRTVAAAGFLAHFRYEHKSVARARLSTHHALRFTINPHCLVPHHHRTLALCIAQVNISGDYEELEVYSPGDQHENNELKGKENEKSAPERRGGGGGSGCGDVAVCALFGRVATLVGGAGHALWCACLFDPLDRPPVAYTLRATVDHDPDADRPCGQPRTYVYRGPADCVRGGQQGGLFLPPLTESTATIALRLRFHRLVPRRNTTATCTQ